MRSILLLTIGSILALPLPVSAQKDKEKTPGDEMIEKYLAAEADKLSAKFLDGAKTIDEWKQKRPRLYQEYMDMLGLWPLPEKTPLMATKTGEVEAHGVVVEKIHFQSKPGLYVTANLYRRKGDNQKRPAIVYVCGHSFKGRDGNKSAHQDHGYWFANNGYVCIILDSLQLGEIPGVHHGTWGQPWRHISTYRASQERERLEHPDAQLEKLPEDKLENRFWWHAIGYSPAAVECWNGVRAIDYLCTRPDVDADRIGVTGISGGGAATFWIAAADERIKVAVPVSGMSDLESYVKNKVVNGHCDCMFLYNTYQWDWTTIAAMIAPRPLLFANSDNDSIFPMDGNRRVMTKLRKIYGMYDKPNLVDEYVSPGGHAYRPDLRVAIFKFLNKHLKGDTTTPVEDCAKYTPLEARKMRVFPEEKDLPKDALNERIDEFFIPQAKVKLPEEGRFGEWKKNQLGELRAKVFRPFPERIPAAKQWGISAMGFSAYQSHFGGGLGRAHLPTDWGTILDFSSLQFSTTDKEFNQKPFGDKKLGTNFGESLEWTWTHKSPPNYVERSQLLLGRTVDQGWLWDAMAMARRISDESGNMNNVRVAGVGAKGILAAYAALFEPSIKEVVVIDPPKSHKEGPYFLNVLRVLDVPEALGLLAPTPLTIIGGNDAAFDRTAEIYRLAGAGDKLKRK
jgi:dienelactone hydrolase